MNIRGANRAGVAIPALLTDIIKAGKDCKFTKGSI
ncbi:hypothetical protein V440_17470 [Clostridioides difficile]|nr:hypothetical protein V440_17470 [Clostridioides difficile]